MIEYGYINEGGYLRSRVIEAYQEQYLEGREKKIRIVSEQEQADRLSSLGWKPVEPLDQTKLIADEGYIIRVMPFDAGDCIKFRYESVRDVQRDRKEIDALKQSLADSDYKVIKCYESFISGEELPYDFASLRAEREATRHRINELEIKIATLY